MTESTIEQTLQKGIEAQNSGRIEEAVHFYTAILKVQPNHAHANHNMGVLAVGVGKIEEALVFLRTALAANSDIVQFWISYIVALIKQGRVVDAQTIFDRAKNFGLEEDKLNTLGERLNSLSTNPEPREIEKDQSQRMSQDPPRGQLQSLKTLLSQGHLQKALDQSQALFQRYPNSAVLLNIQGVILKKMGRIDLAVEAYTKALFVKPDDGYTYFNLGNALKQQGKLEESVGAYTRALSVIPNHADTYYNMGNALRQQGKLEEAIGAYAKALKIMPCFDDAYNNMGNIFRDQEKLGEALEAYNNALAIKPETPEVYTNIGNVLRDQGKQDQAIEAYAKAIAIKPDNAEAYTNMGGVLRDQGQLGEALEACAKALSINPNFVEAWINIGNTLRDQGKLGESLHAYAKAISIHPGYADAHYNIGISLQDQGKLTEAFEAYAKALSINPEFAEACTNMGNVLKEQGKLAEALQAYEYALTIKPEFAPAYNNMGNVLKDIGKLAEAVGAYNQALIIEPNNSESLDNFWSLQVQIQGTDLFRKVCPKYAINDLNPDSKQTPKSHILKAINSFVSSDRRGAHRHIRDFKACDPDLVDKLHPKDKVFCTAYCGFVGALLAECPDEVSDLNTTSTIYHIGESHCLSYAHRLIEMNREAFRIVPAITFGAKAFHFSRKNDDAFKAITQMNLASIPKGSEVFISFGEIDCRPTEGFISAATRLNQPLKGLISSTVDGYLQWFTHQNRTLNHRLYFLNIPAPVYNKGYSPKTNTEVANVVALFNAQIKKQIAQYESKIVDVYRITLGQDGFSNGQFHIDRRHLGAKAIPEIERQLAI